MSDRLKRISQCLLSIVIGYYLMTLFSDIPDNRNTRWVVAIIGGFAGAWLATYLMVRARDLPLIARRLARKHVG